MAADRYPNGDGAWAAFTATRIHIFVAEGTVTVQPDLLPERFPWNHPVHVITAWNPGVVCSVEQNQLANAELEAALRASGHQVYAAEGRSIDGSWVEESYAVEGLSRDEAIAIGRRFSQLAIFEITDVGVDVIACTGELSS